MSVRLSTISSLDLGSVTLNPEAAERLRALEREIAIASSRINDSLSISFLEAERQRATLDRLFNNTNQIARTKETQQQVDVEQLKHEIEVAQRESRRALKLKRPVAETEVEEPVERQVEPEERWDRLSAADFEDSRPLSSNPPTSVKPKNDEPVSESGNFRSREPR